MPGDTLYETDFYAWSQQQAAVLRAMAREAAGLPNALDIENVAEEIEGVGNSQLSAMASRVRLILIHLLKCLSQPDSAALLHWREEMINWHGDLVSDITRAMQPKIDMDVQWRRAMRQAEAALRTGGGALPAGLPTDCPFPLETLLSDDLDIPLLLARIEAATEA